MSDYMQRLINMQRLKQVYKKANTILDNEKKGKQISGRYVRTKIKYYCDFNYSELGTIKPCEL